MTSIPVAYTPISAVVRNLDCKANPETLLFPPWVDNEDRIVNSVIRIATNKPDKRKVYRILRKWYKDNFSLNVCNQVLFMVWKRRS